MWLGITFHNILSRASWDEVRRVQYPGAAATAHMSCSLNISPQTVSLNGQDGLMAEREYGLDG